MHLFVFLLTYPLLLFLSYLPHSVLYLLSDLLSFFLYRVVKFRLKIVRKNLNLSFPKKSISEIKKIERKFYIHFSDLMVEMIKNFSISKNEMLKRYNFKNIELINNEEKKRKSTILLLGHFSNWEGMLTIGSHLIGNAYGIYTPLTNKYFEKKMTISREKYGSFLLSRYKTFEFIESMKSSNDYGLLGFIGDQSPKKDSKSYVRTFMGTKVPVFTGAERIAKNYNFPIFYCQINRVKRGFYEAEISVLAMKPLEYKENEITNLFFNKLERQIVKNPSEYLWTHNRFKHMVD
ncbi:MAG: lysophospholipid acyltransferase family protein [Flavobacteriaceae bacterium]